MGERIDPPTQAEATDPAKSEERDESSTDTDELAEGAEVETPAAQRRARLRKEIREGMQRALKYRD